MHHVEDSVAKYIDPILLPCDLLPDVSNACKFTAVRTIDDSLYDRSWHKKLSTQVREQLWIKQLPRPTIAPGQEGCTQFALSMAGVVRLDVRFPDLFDCISRGYTETFEGDRMAEVATD